MYWSVQIYKKRKIDFTLTTLCKYFPFSNTIYYSYSKYLCHSLLAFLLLKRLFNFDRNYVKFIFAIYLQPSPNKPLQYLDNRFPSNEPKQIIHNTSKIHYVSHISFLHTEFCLFLLK